MSSDPAIEPDTDADRGPEAAAGTVIAHAMVWRGELVAAEDIRVDGTLEGPIESTGTVTVSSGARVCGRISAAAVVIAGRVDGNVAAATFVRLEATAQIVGDIEARRVSLRKGAKVRGKILTQEIWRQGYPGPR